MSSFKEVHSSLNPQQLEAILCTTGPLLVLAGPGSGKTRVLTHRIVQIILEEKALPHEILAVTFTNKAAREMRERCMNLLSKHLPEDTSISHHTPPFLFSSRPWISTFHSLGARILERYIDRLGYQKNFTIEDNKDQQQRIKNLLAEKELENKKDNILEMQKYIHQAKRRIPSQAGEALPTPEIREFYQDYEKQMKKSNTVDFADLLLKPYLLLSQFEDILAFYQNRFKFVLVDEYQDTNFIQYQILRILAIKSQNICLVGDEDQSIYSWRGANVENFQYLKRDFPDLKVSLLEHNYRSTQNIIEASRHLINKNTSRHQKKLFTQNPEGKPLLVRGEFSDLSEAAYVAKSIYRKKQQEKRSYEDFSIFYRTNRQSRVLEEQLRKRSIPYRIIGSLRFYERKEIKDVLSYAKLSMNPHDDLSLQRIINTPTRGIGKSSQEKLKTFANAEGISLFSAIEKIFTKQILSPRACKALANFQQLIHNLKQKQEVLSPLSFYHFLLKETDYPSTLVKTENEKERLEHLQELENALHQFETSRGVDTPTEGLLLDFLRETALTQENASENEEEDSGEGAVSLMTLHASKGLEFPCVFMVGMEEGLCPYVFNHNSYNAFHTTKEEDLKKMEEERRLAYVGITRAQEELTLTYAKQRPFRGDFGEIEMSCFIKEIPSHFLRFEDASYESEDFEEDDSIHYDFS